MSLRIFLLSCSLVLVFAGCSTTDPKPALEPLPNVSPAPLYNLGEVKIQPQAVRQSPPEYPPALRAAGVSGVAVIDFIVGVDGRVEEAKVFKASRPGFGAAALEAVNSWQFKPGRVDGRAVRTHLQVPLVFALNGDVPIARSSVVDRHIPADEKIYDIVDVNQAPTAKRQPPPQYPVDLRSNHIEGKATIEFVVTKTGETADVRMIDATHNQLGQAAKIAVQQWLFSPAIVNGAPVNCRMRVPIIFQIREENL